MERRRAGATNGWWKLLLLPLLFFLGAKLSLVFAVTPEVLVMLWIPNSIILAVLLHGRGRHTLSSPR
jgi:integral membrane sensor domain MASE1